MNTQNPNDRGRFQTAGERLDDFLGDASKHIEEKTQAVIDYINNEVVPLVRENSTKGLHIAADKLKAFANYLDSKQQKPEKQEPEKQEQEKQEQEKQEQEG